MTHLTNTSQTLTLTRVNFLHILESKLKTCFNIFVLKTISEPKNVYLNLKKKSIINIFINNYRNTATKTCI